MLEKIEGRWLRYWDSTPGAVPRAVHNAHHARWTARWHDEPPKLHEAFHGENAARRPLRQAAGQFYRNRVAVVRGGNAETPGSMSMAMAMGAAWRARAGPHRRRGIRGFVPDAVIDIPLPRLPRKSQVR